MACSVVRVELLQRVGLVLDVVVQGVEPEQGGQPEHAGQHADQAEQRGGLGAVGGRRVWVGGSREHGDQLGLQARGEAPAAARRRWGCFPGR